MSSPVTRNLTILLTDIKGFTDKTSHQSRAEMQEMLDRHKAIVLPMLQVHGGKLIKTIGDAFLMVFESPTDAVLAGISVQDALTAANKGRSEAQRLDVRIAINTGEVNLADNDIFGEPVNITARIEAMTEAGEVYFTEAVYLAMNKTEVPSSEVGLLQLKGIPEKIRVYKVRRETPIEGLAATPAGEAPHRSPVTFPAPAGTPPASGDLPRAGLRRRLAGLALDAILCSMLVGMVPIGKSEDVHVRYDRKGAKARVDDKGVRVNLPDKNLHISLDEHGINVRSTPAKRTPAPAPAPAAAKDDDSDSDEDAEHVVYDEGNWRIAKKHQRKSLFPLFWVLYGTLFLGLTGATPGMKVLKLRIVTTAGRPLEWRHSFVRSLSSLFSMYLAFLGYLWAIWEMDRLTWHDLLAGTRVIQAD